MALRPLFAVPAMVAGLAVAAAAAVPGLGSAAAFARASLSRGAPAGTPARTAPSGLPVLSDGPIPSDAPLPSGAPYPSGLPVPSGVPIPSGTPLPSGASISSGAPLPSGVPLPSGPPADATTYSKSGALFGEFVGDNQPLYPAADPFYLDSSATGPAEWTSSYLPAMEAWQAKADDVINLYSSFSQGAELFGYYLPRIWDTYRAVPMVSLSTDSLSADGQGVTDSAVASGRYDAAITSWAQQLKGFVYGRGPDGQPAPTGGRRVYIRLDWEPNGNWSPWSPTAGDPTCAQLASGEAAFVAMWRHVHDLVMAAGPFNDTQVAWVYSVNWVSSSVPSGCSPSVSDVVRALYPGDRYVDWVGVDGYSYADSPASPPEVLGPMFAELRSITTKPLAVTEAGAGTEMPDATAPAQQGGVYEPPAAKGAWIAAFFAYVEASGVRMTLWFNDDKDEDWSVFSQPDAADPLSRGDCQFSYQGTTYNAYCQYAAGVRSPYFATPDPSDPRILSDSEFLDG